MKKKSGTLSQNRQKVLADLAHALIDIPPDCEICDCDERLTKRCEMLIREISPLLRFFFLLSLTLFNRLPFLFGLGIRKFTSLAPPLQKKYAFLWMESRLTALRELIKAFRGIVMICFFSHPDVWEYIGYHPREHAEQKINLRKTLLNPPPTTTPAGT